MSSTAISMSKRRHDVDWMRTLALGFLILYHLVIAFQPWGGMILFITNKEPIEWLWPAMGMLNVWRIPLLFLISGMGVGFAMRNRDWVALLGDRAWRLLLPLAFGFFVICPLYIAMALKWYGLGVRYVPAMGHLWFLANLFAYVVILLPVFVWFKSDGFQGKLDWIRRRLSFPGWLFLLAVPLALEAWIVEPANFSMYYNSLHGFLIGMICFFAGFVAVCLGEAFWNAVGRLRWIALGGALGLYGVRLFVWEMQGVHFVTAIESTCWMLAIVGFSSLYLNRSSRALSYLSAAVYPVYIVHMPVQYALSFVIMPLAIPAVAKLVLLLVGTFAGCFALYEILRRIPLLRPFFGMKWKRKKAAPILDTTSSRKEVSLAS
ncbi:MAG: acyltransferase family protein [Sumerlaeia bacterium]